MNRIFNSSLKRCFARLSALLLCMLAFSTSTQAAVTVSLDDFSIAPGETKTVNVYLANDASDIKQLDFSLVMPAGLSIVNNSSAPDAGRSSGFMTAINSSTGNFLMRGIGTARIAGTSGSVATFQVTASAGLAATSTIGVSGVHAERDGGVNEGGTGMACTVTNTGGGGGGGGSTTTNTVAFDLSETALTMSAGEAKTVDVVMTNTGNFTGLQATFTATTGLTVTSVTAGSRLASPVMFNFNATTGKVIYLGSSPITGTDGTVLTVTLQASPTFSGTATLNVTDIAATDASAVNYPSGNLSLPVTIGATGSAVFSFDQNQVSLDPNTTADVTVSLTSEFAVTGFQGTLVLPAGVTATVAKSDRLPGSIFSYDPNTGNILYGVAAIPTNDGPVFTITLKADNTFTSDAQLQLNNLNVTNASAVNIAAGNLSMTVKAKPLAGYNNLKTAIAALQTKLNNTASTIASTCPTVDKTAEISTLQQQITTLDQKLDADYAANSMDESYFNTQISNISASIDALLTQAQAEESANQNQQGPSTPTPGTPEAQNEEKFYELTTQIAGLQAKLDAAKATIAKDYADVADDFKDDVDFVQKMIKELENEVYNKYYAQALTSSSTISTAAVEQAITALLAAAKAAHEAKNVDPKVIEEVYKSLSAEIDALQKQFDAVKADIEKQYGADIAAALADNEAAVQKQIDALKADLDKKKADKQLSKDSKLDKAAVEEAIKKLQDAAKAKYSEKAYAEQTAKVADLKKQLDAAKASIEADAADVAEVYADKIADLQKQIDELEAKIEVEKAVGEVNPANSEAIAKLQSAIEALVAEAKQAEAAYKAAQANETANEKLTAQVSDVQKKLDEAKETIAKECDLVAADYASQIADLQKQIDDMLADLKKKYEAGELTAQSTLDTESIATAIARMLAAAKAAQGQAVGIDSIMVNESVAEIYDMQGNRIDTPKRGGLYIVKMKDGKSKKMILK